jgi:hypothetical protein
MDGVVSDRHAFFSVGTLLGVCVALGVLVTTTVGVLVVAVTVGIAVLKTVGLRKVGTLDGAVVVLEEGTLLLNKFSVGMEDGLAVETFNVGLNVGLFCFLVGRDVGRADGVS